MKRAARKRQSHKSTRGVGLSMTHSLQSGVQSGIHYPTPVHLQPAHRDLGYKRGDLPVSERAARTVLSLPMFPELTHQQQDEVISAIGSFVLAGAAQ